MDCKVLQHTTTDWWVVGVCVCVCVGRGEETADLKLLGFFFFSSFLWTNPHLHFRASVHHREGREWGGNKEGLGWGLGGDSREGYAALAALLVSSMAVDTCSASSALPTPPPIYPPWGSSGLCVISSLSRRGPGAHQWCLCCSSGGHLLAESESRSTLGMELSSPRYQDCGDRETERETKRLLLCRLQSKSDSFTQLSWTLLR